MSAATVGYAAALEPLLSAPLVAFTAAEAVDFVAVHVLLKDALTQLKEGGIWRKRRRGGGWRR